VNGGELDWLQHGPWATLAVLIAAAVAVLMAGNLVTRRRPRRGSTRPRGDFDLDVARMQDLPVTAIAEAKAGPVHLEAVLVSSTGSLGGAPGRECVWRNRHAGSRSTAVGSELVIAQDASGQVGVERLEQARVLAPKDPGGARHEFASLYLGDRVQLLGRFRRERYGDDLDPDRRVYGMLGVDSDVQIKLLERPAPDSPPTKDPSPGEEA
jgi:hypothetical protein